MDAVHEEQEAHRCCRNLGTIKHLEMASGTARRLIVLRPLRKSSIQGRCIDPLLQLLPNAPYGIKQLAYIRTVESGYWLERSE